jgi:hypothetical protein
MQKININIPTPIFIGTTYKFWRSEIEHEKARLRSVAMGREAPEYIKPDIDELVNAATVAKEFAISGRTLSRRIKELQDAEAVNQAAE